MAQELFMNDEEKMRLKKQELVARGMQLWRTNAEEYRTLPLKYSFYLTEKRNAKIPLHKISTAYYREDIYPRIPLFRIFEEDEALAWLEDAELTSLEIEVKRIEDELNTNYLYRSMKDWVVEAIYTLTHKKPDRYSLACAISTNTTRAKYTTTKSAIAD